MKAILAALGLLLAAAPARAASTETARSQTGWVDDYTDLAKQRLRDLGDQLDATQKDAQRLGGEAKAAADERITQLQKQLDKSQKDVDRLRRTGQLKASKARKRLDAAIEDLRREYEGLRKDLEEKEPDPQR